MKNSRNVFLFRYLSRLLEVFKITSFAVIKCSATSRKLLPHIEASLSAILEKFTLQLCTVSGILGWRVLLRHKSD